MGTFFFFFYPEQNVSARLMALMAASGHLNENGRSSTLQVRLSDSYKS